MWGHLYKLGALVPGKLKIWELGMMAQAGDKGVICSAALSHPTGSANTLLAEIMA